MKKHALIFSSQFSIFSFFQVAKLPGLFLAAEKWNTIFSAEEVLHSSSFNPLSHIILAIQRHHKHIETLISPNEKQSICMFYDRQ